MTMVQIGLTLQTAGTLCIGFATLMVHHRVASQALIDRSVARVMNNERKIGFAGLALVFIGYILQII